MSVLAPLALLLAAYAVHLAYITVFYHRALAHRAVRLRPATLRFALANSPEHQKLVAAYVSAAGSVLRSATGNETPDQLTALLMAALPDNIKQSDPSHTAFATSVASARVGRGFATID